MKFSSVDGRDVDRKYERFYTFGTRGFSIWRAADMQQVFDSGSDIEKKTAELRPDIFNADIYNDPYNDHRQSADMRSDFKVMKLCVCVCVCVFMCVEGGSARRPCFLF